MRAAHASTPSPPPPPPPPPPAGALPWPWRRVRLRRETNARPACEAATRTDHPRGRARLRGDSQERGHRDPVRFTRDPRRRLYARAREARDASRREEERRRESVSASRERIRRARRDMPASARLEGRVPAHRTIKLSGARRAAGGCSLVAASGRDFCEKRCALNSFQG